ncbi:MAG: hypothetical protein V4642_14460 [Bacteroidota bacterium]
MRFKNVVFSAVFISVIFLGSCAEDAVVSPPKEDVLMPLKVGNTWNYLIMMRDSSTTTNETNSGPLSMSIAGDTTISGSKWYGMAMPYAGIYVYYQNKADGVWANFQGMSTPMLMFKYPADLNSGYPYKLVSKTESVVVPAGTFSCYHYQHVSVENPVNFEHYYLAPNIGIVKQTKSDGGDNGSGGTYLSTSTMELQSYTLK